MQFDPYENYSVPQPPEVLEKTRHRFVLKDGSAQEGLFEVERETSMDAQFGSVTSESHSLHQLGCRHVIRSPEEFAGLCSKCNSSMCQACQIRCGRCLRLNCPSCIRITDGKPLCKSCGLLHCVLDLLGSGFRLFHELLKREF